MTKALLNGIHQPFPGQRTAPAIEQLADGGNVSIGEAPSH
jgi:hypothetical protein